MTPPIKSILSCLVILATASGIEIKRMRELERSQKLGESDNTVAVLGEGLAPRQVPIIIYSLKPNFLEMMVYIQSTKTCHFKYPYHIDTSIKFRTVKQLTTNRVIILWSVSDKVTVATKVLLYDIDLCAPLNKYEFSSKLSPGNMVAVVRFIDGFELITWDNHRAAYDTNGRPRGTKEYFPTNSVDFSISAVSERTRDKGYFIVDSTRKTLDLIKADGTLNIHLLNLDRLEVLTNNEQSLYTACAFNPQTKVTVTCYRYDQAGNRLWINSAQIEFDRLLDVKNLAGGGLAFVASKSKGKLFFVKIGNKVQDVKIWSYTGEQTFEEARLMDFTEKGQKFYLAFKTRVVGSTRDVVAGQTYLLEN